MVCYKEGSMTYGSRERNTEEVKHEEDGMWHVFET